MDNNHAHNAKGQIPMHTANEKGEGFQVIHFVFVDQIRPGGVDETRVNAFYNSVMLNHCPDRKM